MPEITHYQKDNFNADSQFWTACEGKDGVLYFGNNDGTIIFNGEKWYKVILPNHSSVRCLVADEEGNIYAGGFNELGLIKKDDYGNYYFESLLNKLNIRHDNLANLWQAHSLQGLIIYRSFTTLLVISNQNKVVSLPTIGAYVRSYVIDGQYFVQDHTGSIFHLDLKNLQLIRHFNGESFNKEEIINLLPSSLPHRLIGLSKSGKVYFFNKDSREVSFKLNLFVAKEKDQVLTAIKSKEGDYYIGTLSNKIITLKEYGNDFIYEENFQHLQDKTVLDLFQSSKGNLWAMLNNGLDCINLNAPVSRLLDNTSIYDVLFKDENMYVAGNQGVFYAEAIHKTPLISSQNFKRIKELEGQTWKLQVIEGDILVSHDKGLYHLRGNDSYQIGDFGGIWKVTPIKGREGYYFANSYHGLYVVKKGNSGKWEYIHKVEGFVESTRDIMDTDNPRTYWVCHGYKGVFRINLNEDFTRVTAIEHYTTQNGFHNPYGINVFKWEGHTIFTSEHGVYTFNEELKEFVPFNPLNSILDTTTSVKTIFQHKEKTWFVQDDEVGYFETGSENPEIVKNRFLQFKGSFNRGMECIIPLENEQVLFGTKAGLYIFNLHYKNPLNKVPTIINSVGYSLGNHTFIPLRLHNNSGTVRLPNKTTQLVFEFSTPAMKKDATVEYSHMLEDIDTEWSQWSQLPFKEYNYLPAGKYTFKVKSRNLLGMTGNEDTYEFEILPLWYQTIWAYMLFFILGTFILFILVFLIIKKITRENYKARKEEEKARKLLELELTQMKLQAEKDRIAQEKNQLLQDIEYKSKELANYTILLSKKSEILMELQEDLKDLKDHAKNEHSRTAIREALKKINSHMADEEYLKVFEVNFEKVHQNFFAQLKELHPDLNQRELRLCAFVKMNLTNKEISPLLNISVRGVETARYRLRKKFNLEHEDNLVEYLENLSSLFQHKELDTAGQG